MPLKTQLNDELKDAMRSGDTTRRTTIRYLLSIIQNEEIAKRSELDDEGILAVLSRQAQQRRDSIEAFEKADRQDLVDKEKAELAYILPYLPQHLSPAELTELDARALSDAAATAPAAHSPPAAAHSPPTRAPPARARHSPHTQPLAAGR